MMLVNSLSFYITDTHSPSTLLYYACNVLGSSDSTSLVHALLSAYYVPPEEFCVNVFLCADVLSSLIMSPWRWVSVGWPSIYVPFFRDVSACWLLTLSSRAVGGCCHLDVLARLPAFVPPAPLAPMCDSVCWCSPVDVFLSVDVHIPMCFCLLTFSCWCVCWCSPVDVFLSAEVLFFSPSYSVPVQLLLSCLHVSATVAGSSTTRASLTWTRHITGTWWGPTWPPPCCACWKQCATQNMPSRGS